MDKILCTHNTHTYSYDIIECYSAIQMNEIVPFVTEWLQLKNNILSEIDQTQKNTTRSLLCVRANI